MGSDGLLSVGTHRSLVAGLPEYRELTEAFDTDRRESSRREAPVASMPDPRGDVT